MSDTPSMTFWDHLDELRGVIIRVLVVAAVGAAAAFCLKDELFAIVLAPRTSDFITYRLMGIEPFSIHLMNIGLTEQFMIHLKTAFYAGILLTSPYIIYQLFRFVSPALYDNEKRYATLLCTSGYLMFMLGTALNYLLIFPLTVRFLGTYQVSPDVANMLTLQSYIDDESGDGHRVRASCSKLSTRENETYQCHDDESCAPTRFYSYTHHIGHHHPYNRCLYTIRGGTTHLAAL